MPRWMIPGGINLNLRVFGLKGMTDLVLERDGSLLWVEPGDSAHKGGVAGLEDSRPALVLPCEARDEHRSHPRKVPACAEHTSTQGCEWNVGVL